MPSSACAQHADQASHLGQGLGPGRLDRVEGLERRPGIRLHRLAGTARLQDHDADGVRDRVVELARDPRSLIGHRGVRLLDPGDFQRGFPLPPRADRESRQPRPAEQQERQRDIAELDVRVDLSDDIGSEEDPDTHGTGDGHPSTRVRADRVRRHHHRDDHRDRTVDRLDQRDDRGDDGKAKGEERRLLPPGQ